MVALSHTWGKGRIEMAMEGGGKKKANGAVTPSQSETLYHSVQSTWDHCKRLIVPLHFRRFTPKPYKEKINDLLDLKRCKETGSYCRSSSTESLLSTQQSLISCCFQVRARHLLNENKRFL